MKDRSRAQYGSNVMDALAAPAVAQKPPTGHGEHSAEPGIALNVPTGHGVHCAAPGLGLCAPRAQGKHMIDALMGE